MTNKKPLEKMRGGGMDEENAWRWHDEKRCVAVA